MRILEPHTKCPPKQRRGESLLVLTDPSRNSEGEERAERILEDRIGRASQGEPGWVLQT